MNEVQTVKPTGGCLGCAHCKMQRGNGWCNQFSKSGKYTKLSQKQLYNTKGYCSKFLDKNSAKEEKESQNGTFVF